MGQGLGQAQSRPVGISRFRVVALGYKGAHYNEFSRSELRVKDLGFRV